MAKQQEPASKPNAAETAAHPSTENQPASRKSALAFFALIIALASLLVQAWIWLGREQSDLSDTLTRIQNNQQTQRADGRSLQTKIASLTDKIEQLENRQGPVIPPDYSEDIISLRAETARLARQSGAMQSRLMNESAITQTNDRHMLRAEVEYLLRLGNERLQLFGDRQAALATLQLAEQQLAAMDDPLMLPVRQQLQQDIRNLANIEVADPLIILSGIQELESSLPDWPLQQVAAPAAAQPEPVDDGILDRIRRSMMSLVTISRQEQAVLTLEEIDWLRERIRAQFQVARIASMNGDQELFHNALQTVLQWHAENYQPDDSANVAVRKSLQQLIATVLRPDYPDITRALREMQFIGSPLTTEPGQPAPAEQAEHEIEEGDTGAGSAGAENGEPRVEISG